MDANALAGALIPDGDDTSPATTELCIEFAGTQLTVRLNDPAMTNILREAYAFMLKPCGSSVTGGNVLDLATTLPIKLEVLQFVMNEISKRFVAARPELLWLHAGAVERHGRVLVIAGESGQGKSTLTTALCGQGWHYLSDDVAPIDMAVDTVMPYPQMPRRRVYSERHLTPGEVQTLDRKVVPISPEAVRLQPAPIAGFVFLDFRLGANEDIAKLSAGEFALALVGSSKNFLDHRHEAVARAAEIARRIPAYRLVYDDPAAAIAAINSVFSAAQRSNLANL